MRVFFSRYYRGGEATLEANVPRYREITSKAVDLMIFFLKRMQDVPSYGIGMRVREVNTVLLTFEAKVNEKTRTRRGGGVEPGWADACSPSTPPPCPPVFAPPCPPVFAPPCPPVFAPPCPPVLAPPCPPVFAPPLPACVC